MDEVMSLDGLIQRMVLLVRWIINLYTSMLTVTMLTYF